MAARRLPLPSLSLKAINGLLLQSAKVLKILQRGPSRVLQSHHPDKAFLDLFRFLGDCPPTPSPSQHFAQSEK